MKDECRMTNAMFARLRRVRVILHSAFILLLFSACRQGMYNQAKQKPLSQSDFFSDGASARPLPLHTISRESASTDALIGATNPDGTLVTKPPVPLTKELLYRGKERFEIYCAVCHDRTGSGNGMIVQRGFPHPPAFTETRLRNAPIGHFYDVITNGYGAMYPYAARVEPRDRWAIAAYIRALQLSRSGTINDVPTDQRAELESQVQ